MWPLVWGLLAILFGFVVVVPFAAAAAVAGRTGRAALGLVGFALVVSFSSPTQASSPIGYTKVAASSNGPAGSGTTVTCTPGTGTFFDIPWASFEGSGTCPAEGTFTCDQSAYFNFSAYSGGWCYVEASGTGGGDGDPSTGGGGLPALSGTQGVRVAAAILGVWAIGWAVRAARIALH